MTEWYQKKKQAGICAGCGAVDERVLSGKVYCAACSARILDGQKKRRAYLRSQGRCIHCGKRDERTELGRCACAACAQKNDVNHTVRDSYERYKAMLRKRRAERRAAGVCTVCGGAREEEGMLMCMSCRAAYREYTKKCGTERN